MDPPLDPRLQAPPPPQSNEQSLEQSQPSNYPEPITTTSTPNKHTPTAIVSADATPNQQHNHQHHSYYSAPTSSSYDPGNADGGPPTYPYDNGLPPYGVPPPPGIHYGHPLPTVAEVAADLKRPRACEACRQLKVKCEPDDVVAGTCRRCFRSGRQCVVTMPSRKRQKKSDSRVAELEKKIDALTSSLQAQHGQPHRQNESESPADGTPQYLHPSEVRAALYGESNRNAWISQRPTSSQSEEKGSESAQPSEGSSLKRSYPDDGDPGSQPPKSAMSTMPTFFELFSRKVKEPKSPGGDVDIVARKIIDAPTAYRCFERYVNDMAGSLPFVVFPPGARAEDIRKSKPILFLAIVTAACNVIRPDLRAGLVVETMRAYADRVVCRGEKSMELVQALLVSTTWYAPPERYEELNFNQLIHMAAVMAIDLGMGKRTKPGYMGAYNYYLEKRAFARIPDPDNPETRRTWLGCYFMCANASMSLRRPLLIRWTGYMDDCLEVLESSKEALPSDKWLVCLVKGQHLVEEVGFQFSMDDPTVEISITEAKTQYHLKAFERQLNEWRNQVPAELRTPLFDHASSITSLYVHEIAMHQNHNIDDFKPPYTVQAETSSPEPDVITPAHIDALTVCIQEIQCAFDAVLSMDIRTLQSLPTLTYVRTSYAAVALIKLSLALTGPNRRFGDVFKVEDLKADYYLDAVMKQFRAVGEGDNCTVAARFSFIFGMLRTWMQKRTEPETRENPSATDSKSIAGSVQPVLGQPTIQQNSSSQWSAQPAPLMGATDNLQSGLHMLSELASSSNNTNSATSVGNSVAMPSTASSWPQQYAGTQGFASGFANESYLGMMGGVDMDVMGFDADDWTAFNIVAMDPSWMPMSMQQGGFHSL